MLKLKEIRKTYATGDLKVEALKGVSINFRKNEFVSILGPSGCGKTTLLNIIGGLDKYTSGDLVISGISTKEFKDRDWDVYRNHRIGFVFQSYNLIPHQTVLGNVELALTIGGIDKETRIEKAKKALERVGLGKEINKKPNQLSGGQCQRVAIARALVNEPDILLADEPTGALDTVTSVQIMDLIKEIAKEKLVIMVTHNPELAEQYSTRIIRLLDGEVQTDTNPCSDVEEMHEIAKEDSTSDDEGQKNKKKKTKMSFWTAFKLSGKNLLSKFKRTFMVGLAGSIGIIGICAVLALSSGIRDYIADMQEDMLSGNPITIQETTYDLNAITNAMSANDVKEIEIKDGIVNVNSVLEHLAQRVEMLKNIMVSNEITKDYIDYVKAIPQEYVEEVLVDYGIAMSNNIYANFKVSKDSEPVKTSLTAIKSIYRSILNETEYAEYSGYISSLSPSMGMAIKNKDYILSQYDLIAGDKVATEANEIMLVVNKNRQVSDLLLAQLGIYTQNEFLDLVENAFSKEENEEQENALSTKQKLATGDLKTEFTYEELLGTTFTWYPNDVVFEKNDSSPFAENFPFNYKYKIEGEDLNKGIELKVVGILQPKENLNYGTLSSGFYYTSALQEKVLEANMNSEIVNYLGEDDDAAFETSLSNFSDFSDPMALMQALISSHSRVILYLYNFEYNGEVLTGFDIVLGKTNLMSMMQGDAKISLSKRDLGGIDVANYVEIYPKNFETKEKVLEYLDKWNDQDAVIKINGKEITGRKKITYTDTLSLVIAMINTMISVVTTALVAFTAISLVVSTVMIGIITYVSVVERTKEIGVIRSLGGRKKDVAHLFNAETFIIGFAAGLLGVIITIIITLIANIFIYKATGIRSLATVKITHAVIMITISVLLTLISGLFPSRAAAKMDPVNALRSE